VPRRIALLLVVLALSGCQRPVATGASAGAQIDRLSVLRAGDSHGFALADTPRRFEFPQDHGPHPSFRHEWWYLTGQLSGPAGATFGFELTFFRLALLPQAPSTAGPAGSAWRARQVYAAHFAITDVSRGRFFNTSRVARDALGLAGATAEPFAVQVDDWSLRQAPGGDARHWQLLAADGDYQLQLDLRADQAPVLNGDAGLSRKADAAGAASYYYSMPHLWAAGRLSRAGTALPVSGQVWLDREWGSGSLGAQLQGWDWFALDLDDGSTLMFYSLRDRDGRRDPHSAGTFVDATGKVTPLAAVDLAIDVRRYWNSPRGGRYPAQWTLRIKSLALALQVTPLLADQELSTEPRYWEGAVQVTGTHRAAPITARGYVELVGYAQAQASPSTPSATAAPTH
jgi:predicted secreted hydrolase